MVGLTQSTEFGNLAMVKMEIKFIQRVAPKYVRLGIFRRAQNRTGSVNVAFIIQIILPITKRAMRTYSNCGYADEGDEENMY